MQLTVKYHGDLCSYFPDDGEDHSAKINVGSEDSVFSVIDRFNIPHEKIQLVLVNGVKVSSEDCHAYRFSDGDVLAVWPQTG